MADKKSSLYQHPRMQIEALMKKIRAKELSPLHRLIKRDPWQDPRYGGNWRYYSDDIVGDWRTNIFPPGKPEYNTEEGNDPSNPVFDWGQNNMLRGIWAKARDKPGSLQRKLPPRALEPPQMPVEYNIPYYLQRPTQRTSLMGQGPLMPQFIQGGPAPAPVPLSPIYGPPIPEEWFGR